jgi:NAD(P)-dependent dehydrogenase (short-subunit alcohol dehydrogenase family)
LTTNVVIGAGSGMGAAVAARLAGDRRLLLADRDVDAAARVAEHLPGEVEVVACDITDDEAVRAVAAATGALGGLVLTAGLSPTMADGARVVDVNLLGTFRVVTAFEAVLQPGSAAVCFASMAAHLVPSDPAVDAILDHPEAPDLLDRLAELGLTDHSGIAYAVSKRGVIRLVERHAATWGAKGARIVSVSPGVIDTPMGRAEDAATPEMAEMVRTSALAREGTAAELATVAAFLVSDQASFLTGTDVLVDGGVVAHTRSTP